jgi:uncharacterized protein (UPF0254 family)
MRRRRRGELRGGTEPLVNLNTRIPRVLYRRVKVASVEQDREMQEFVAEAIRERLRARRGR